LEVRNKDAYIKISKPKIQTIMKNLFALLLVTGIALSALCQEAVQRFRLVGDYSSKWEIYEITEDSCGEFEFTRDFDGRTVKIKRSVLKLSEEGGSLFLKKSLERKKTTTSELVTL